MAVNDETLPLLRARARKSRCLTFVSLAGSVALAVT
jgi:hypothetical protein